MARHAMKYGFSDEERKAFKERLIKTDYIAAPQKIYTDERVFERQEVCRDYLEREELKVIASPFHRPDGKCCTKCGVWKPFAAFYPNGKGGISSDCRDCRNNAYKLYYEKHLKRSTVKVDPPEFKVCRTCGERKPISEYRKSCKSADGRQTVCKECMRILIRKGKTSASRCVTTAAVEEPKMERLTPEVIKPYPVVEHGE